MTTAFSAIVTAIIAALQAGTPVCDTIYRARPNEVPDQVEQAVNVQFEQALPADFTMNGQPIDWTTKISVECYARSMKESGDLAVDPLLAEVYARLMQDTTLGGLVGQLRVAGIEAENTAGAKRTGWVRLTCVVEHTTCNSTLEQL